VAGMECRFPGAALLDQTSAGLLADAATANRKLRLLLFSCVPRTRACRFEKRTRRN